VNTKGELTLAPLDPSYGAQRSSLERPPSSLDARHTSMESLRTCPEPSEEGASGEGARFSLEQEGSFAEWEEAEEEGASPSEREAQEKLSQRRAMLVNSLKSNKGRKRFIEWLYRLADTTQDSTVSQGELVVFLKAISADGINPESFVDPAEDYDDDRRRPTLPLDPEPEPEPLVRTRSDHTVRKSVDEQRKPGYLEQLAERIMERYNDSGTGRLAKEEFMQLAAMVEREYELMDNAYTGADLIGPYRLTRTLGKGAEGVVKLGVNTESGEKKAVKIIRKGNIAALSRVDTEVEAMVMLDHPSVVAVKEVLETEASIFLVMEYCAGGHLEDYISPTRPMSEAAGRFYFGQLMAGVTYCHEKGVCHRDLRVENLMLDNRGHLKITDFGHAGIFQQGWDVFQTMMVGSVSHLAPEQITGTVYSGEKIDIWSMGIILYLMVMGRAPFQAESPEELLEHIKEGQYLKPTEGVISEECCAVIDSMLQVEQQARKPLVELKEMAWMEGARERLVLAHGEFSLTHRTTEPAFLDDLKKILATASVQVREKTKGDVAEALPGHPSLPGTPTPARPPLDPANPAPAETGYVSEEEGEPDATVRTVAADEEVEELPGGARTVSVSVLHCVHETHKMVFKVSVTMVSVDAGRANLLPVLAFDLQSGEAALFQKVFRRVKAEFGDRVKGADRQHKTKLVNTRVDDTHLPLMDLAEGMGLGRKPSYLHMARSSGSFSRDSATLARSSGTWPR